MEGMHLAMNNWYFFQQNPIPFPSSTKSNKSTTFFNFKYSYLKLMLKKLQLKRILKNYFCAFDPFPSTFTRWKLAHLSITLEFWNIVIQTDKCIALARLLKTKFNHVHCTTAPVQTCKVYWPSSTP